MKFHYLKEYLLKAGLEKAGIKEINAPYVAANFLANSMTENLGGAGRISDEQEKERKESLFAGVSADIVLNSVCAFDIKVLF